MKIETAQVEIIAPRDQLNFLHQHTVEMARPLTPLEAWFAMTRDPLPLLQTAFRIRDAVSARFGVARIGGLSGREPGFVQAGDRLDFFTVETIDDTRLSLTARDRHLDTMSCLTVRGRTLTLTSSVKVHNWFGRLYMLPVAPAHRVIVRRMMARLT
ncbi:DUF2867 domain-containing protein [Sulfitobacter albidus]|uniref:DUF2867 domain-containing protein n=1 Tax=Sulfitobacter albidus TaxID=2829501 RepID=A0A975PM24_9RHOB|nr:DUF2867 domain-containing protein [Sulfitobacter albidus]QUJ75785.1 DUF2867 domain-containing protein [Sulfitobacter albidus]